MFSSLLLALVPIANSARDPKWRSVSPLIALGCAAIVWAISPVVAKTFYTRNHLFIVAAVVSASLLISTCYLLRIIYRVHPRGWVPAAIWIGLTCLVPVIFDCGAWILGPSDDNFIMTGISSFSPIGALAMSFDSAWIDLIGGLTGQAVLAAGWVLLFYVSGRRKNRPANLPA
jgi:hypothetical protein